MEGESERNVQAERRAAADAEFARLEVQVGGAGTGCGHGAPLLHSWSLT